MADDGTESAIASPVVWPEVEQVKMGLVRPMGTAFGPDGTAYVVDSHMVTIFGVTPDGSLRNYRDTAPINSLYGIAVTPDNRIFAVGGSGWGIVEVDPERGNIVRKFAGATQKSTTPGSMSLPFAIAADARGRLFVSERHSKTVQVYSSDGELLRIIDEGFEDPLGLGVIERDGKVRLAVADFSKQNLQVIELDSETLDMIGKTEITPRGRPLCAAFDESGRMYIGTYNGIDRYEDGKITAHWQSKFNNKGHTVWGIAIRGNSMICTEGDINEKYWMKGRLEDFKRVE